MHVVSPLSAHFKISPIKRAARGREQSLQANGENLGRVEMSWTKRGNHMPASGTNWKKQKRIIVNFFLLSLFFVFWHCNTLQHTATHCDTLRHTVTHCDTLRHTATHCNCVHIELSCTIPEYVYIYYILDLYSSFTHTHTHTHIHIHTHTHQYTRTQTRTHTHKHTQAHKHAHKPIDLSIIIHTHTKMLFPTFFFVFFCAYTD